MEKPVGTLRVIIAAKQDTLPQTAEAFRTKEVERENKERAKDTLHVSIEASKDITQLSATVARAKAKA